MKTEKIKRVIQEYLPNGRLLLIEAEYNRLRIINKKSVRVYPINIGYHTNGSSIMIVGDQLKLVEKDPLFLSAYLRLDIILKQKSNNSVNKKENKYIP